MTTARNEISCDRKLSVAIFGLSANPPTGDEGHVGIVKYLVETGGFDEVWILPVYQHIFVAKRALETFDHRLNMCNLCFAPLSSDRCIVRVFPLEKEAYESACSTLKKQKRNQKQFQNQNQNHQNNQNYSNSPKPSEENVPDTIEVEQPLRLGTIDIIRFIKNKNKNENTSEVTTDHRINTINTINTTKTTVERDLDIHLVLGSDTYVDLMMGKWKDAESLVSQVTLEVFQRLGGPNITDMVSKEGSPSPIREVASPITDKATVVEHYLSGLGSISSSAIRSWEPPLDLIEKQIHSIIRGLDIFNIFGMKMIGKNIENMTPIDPIDPKHALHPKVFEYIIENELYFSSREAKRKVFYRRVFSVSIGVAVTLAAGSILRRNLNSIFK